MTPAPATTRSSEVRTARITPREFRLFQALIFEQAGIQLSDAKESLLVGRLQGRLRALGLDTFSQYYQYVTEKTDGELVRLLDCICTNETHFFREPQHYAFLESRVFPEWEAQAAAGTRDRRLRVWSAACSTGEEPYTLAMVLLDRFPPDAGWSIDILATDLSTKVLSAAQAALWPITKAAEIPRRQLTRYMLRGTGASEGLMKAGDEVRRAVRFQRLNLNHEQYDVPTGFDLVFCRNVLIYFSPESRGAVVKRLFSHLAPTGYLFLGHAETLVGVTEAGRPVVPTVYVKQRALGVSR